MAHRRSKAARQRRNLRSVEFQRMVDIAGEARDRRSVRFSGLLPEVSAMSYGPRAASRYTHEVWSEKKGDFVPCVLKDTRDGVMVKNRPAKGASDKELLGSTKRPNDLRVSVRIWDAETDQRRTVMVPAYMVDIIDPKRPAARPLTQAEKYARNGWSH